MSHSLVGRPMEILLIEDGLVDARLTIGALKKSGVKHRLTLIRDGVEAMEFLGRKGHFARAPRPDLILLDLQLPKKDGREVLAEVREEPSLKQIPVVILTSSESSEDKLTGERLEVDAYMTKPVNFDKFLAVVRQLSKCWMADLILPPMP